MSARSVVVFQCAPKNNKQWVTVVECDSRRERIISSRKKRGTIYWGESGAPGCSSGALVWNCIDAPLVASPVRSRWLERRSLSARGRFKGHHREDYAVAAWRPPYDIQLRFDRSILHFRSVKHVGPFFFFFLFGTRGRRTTSGECNPRPGSAVDLVNRITNRPRPFRPKKQKGRKNKHSIWGSNFKTLVWISDRNSPRTLFSAWDLV